MANKNRPNHLAEFEFQPDHDWTPEEARYMYWNRLQHYHDFILYKDCREYIQFLKDQSIDLIIADPPFGINFDGKTKQKNYNRKSKFVLPGYVEIPTKDYGKFSEEWICQLASKLKETGSMWIISGYNNLHHIKNALDKTDLVEINHIIWRFPFSLPCTKKFSTNHYHIFYYAKNEKKRFFNRIIYYDKSVWDINKENHPGQLKNGTKLPYELLRRIITYCTKPGDLIVDPFMGNGSTAECAKANYRHFYGYEINELAQPLIDERLNKIKLGEKYQMTLDQIPDLYELSQKEGYQKAFLQHCKNNEIDPSKVRANNE